MCINSKYNEFEITSYIIEEIKTDSYIASRPVPIRWQDELTANTEFDKLKRSFPNLKFTVKLYDKDENGIDSAGYGIWVEVNSHNKKSRNDYNALVEQRSLEFSNLNYEKRL